MARALEWGIRMTSDEAKAYVEDLASKMYETWQKKVFQGAFMRDLTAGKLSRETIRLFWKHWYSYPVEINNFHLMIYQRHMGLFTRHPELLAPYVGKISDELVNPSIPGHIQILIEQGEIFGLTRDDMVNCEVYPECRALTEFARGLVYEGAVVEWWARSLNEEMFGHWSRAWGQALLKHYGYREEEIVYFQVHEEADLVGHDGIMGHGQVARTVLQQVLEDGLSWTRPGWSPEYCCVSNAALVGMFHDGIYANSKELGHFG